MSYTQASRSLRRGEPYPTPTHPPTPTRPHTPPHTPTHTPPPTPPHTHAERERHTHTHKEEEIYRPHHSPPQAGGLTGKADDLADKRAPDRAIPASRQSPDHSAFLPMPEALMRCATVTLNDFCLYRSGGLWRWFPVMIRQRRSSHPSPSGCATARSHGPGCVVTALHALDRGGGFEVLQAPQSIADEVQSQAPLLVRQSLPRSAALFGGGTLELTPQETLALRVLPVG
jgi:hypothetical protein